MITITGTSISKRFSTQLLFKKLNLSMSSASSWSITGQNGSGKSTLLQIIAKIQQPTRGTIEYISDNELLNDEKIHDRMSYTGPLINPYEELTGEENLSFCSSSKENNERGIELLDYFDIFKHKSKALKHYSSGMKQRLKLCLALCNNPHILFLDEPSMYLDSSGIDKLFNMLSDLSSNILLVIATNEKTEKDFCQEEIHLG